MGLQIYIASSWKNELFVKKLARLFRKHGLQVYCFAEMGEGQHIFNWPDVVSQDDDGITALQSEDSAKAFRSDKFFLEWANCCVLYNPCGRDAHLEAGYIRGKGGMLYILGQFPKGEFQNMYHLATGLFRITELRQLVDELKIKDGITADPGIVCKRR